MEHIIELQHGHDCIKFECITKSKRCYPASGGSHGIHGLDMRFISKGDDGAEYPKPKVGQTIHDTANYKSVLEDIDYLLLITNKWIKEAK